MGVLACDRNGCDNIMCDYYSHERGYICYECLKELLSKPDINISTFVSTPKSNEEFVRDWETHVRQEFKSRWEE